MKVTTLVDPSKMFKKNNITRRWFVNVLAVFALVIFVLEVAFAFFYSNYYYGVIANSADAYSQAFNSLGTASKSEFAAKAREYAEQFEDKNKIEIQIIGPGGEVIVSTSGFTPSQVDMPDYLAAHDSLYESASWRGKGETGQKIFARTHLLGDTQDGSGSAVRWVIATEKIDHHITMVTIIAIALGFVVLIFTFVSGLYFVRSIVKPVQAVTFTARRIALGDFDTRIESTDEGEIGELCDSINYIASELGGAENMKNDFISSVSHELRTPLTAIRGWGETIKMAIGSDDELVEKGISVILGESDRLSGLVEDLLDFSRMQSGSLSMNMTKTQLTQPLREAVEMYRELARQQDIDLIFMKPKASPVIMGDADRLKQVFINIIDNAIKYNRAGGHVLIECELEEACVRVTIKDTGIGIPEQDIDNVKKKFYKSNKTIRGSGIGLAVADEILKQHQGLLFVESREAIGTTVTIVVPTVEEEKEDDAESLIPPTSLNILNDN